MVILQIAYYVRLVYYVSLLCFILVKINILVLYGEVLVKCQQLRSSKEHHCEIEQVISPQVFHILVHLIAVKNIIVKKEQMIRLNQISDAEVLLCKAVHFVMLCNPYLSFRFRYTEYGYY